MDGMQFTYSKDAQGKSIVGKSRIIVIQENSKPDSYRIHSIRRGKK
jgi:hypothetical protein